MTRKILAIETDLQRTKMEYILDDGRTIIGYEQFGGAEITETQVKYALEKTRTERSNHAE